MKKSIRGHATLKELLTGYYNPFKRELLPSPDILEEIYQAFEQGRIPRPEKLMDGWEEAKTLLEIVDENKDLSQNKTAVTRFIYNEAAKDLYWLCCHLTALIEEIVVAMISSGSYDDSSESDRLEEEGIVRPSAA